MTDSVLTDLVTVVMLTSLVDCVDRFGDRFVSFDRFVLTDSVTLLTDLRKQARQLENEIDLKLVSFSKLGTSYSTHRDVDR